MSEHKKFILAVQGEGRGHMTQALSTYDLLVEQGHTVCAVVLGSSGTREVPAFFFERVKCPIVRLQSPNFVSDSRNKGINISRTILYNLRKAGAFRRSLREIHHIMEAHQPDIVLNFFDLLFGLYYRYYKPKAKMVCVAHQYIYFHPDFEFPEGRWLDKVAIKFYSRLTASRSTKNLALSFYSIHTAGEGVVVVPPLLRKEVFELETTRDDFYLVYLVNNGYFEEVLEWHTHHPGTVVHCFTDQPEVIKSNYTFDETRLMVHAINDKLFLELMSKARGLASSAGFESVCEAMYLGKPVMMVPIEGHYEQFCNSRDACKAGAGIFADRFDLSKLQQITVGHPPENTWFRDWVFNAKLRIYNEILSA
jgi:uncharacterized protein (TIGR00661 family)